MNLNDDAAPTRLVPMSVCGYWNRGREMIVIILAVVVVVLVLVLA